MKKMLDRVKIILERDFVYIREDSPEFVPPRAQDKEYARDILERAYYAINCMTNDMTDEQPPRCHSPL